MQRHGHRRTGSDLPGLDLAERQAWQHYFDAVLHFDAAINRLLNDAHKLAVIDLRVLDALDKSRDASARMSQLADVLAATRRQMTKRIDRLEARELVQRGPDPQDRRGVVALITAEGRALADQARHTYARGVDDLLLSPLSARQVNTVAENCWRIGEHLRNPAGKDHLGVVPQEFPGEPGCHLPGIDDAGKRCWYRFQEAAGALFPALHDRFTEAHQLALTDVLMLELLARSARGALPMNAFGAAFALIPSRVTQLVTRLQSRGLVHRGSGQGDRRVVVATITERGRARLAPALMTYSRLIHEIYLESMSRQQAIALGDACRRICLALKTAAH